MFKTKNEDFDVRQKNKNNKQKSKKNKQTNETVVAVVADAVMADAVMADAGDPMNLLVRECVTENRLMQGIFTISEGNEFNKYNALTYLEQFKTFMKADILREEDHEIREKNMDIEKLQAAIDEEAESWFYKYILTL
jgi:hypothetical protein